MEHFYTIRLNRWKRWLVVIVFALFTAGFLFFNKDGAFFLSIAEETGAFSKGNADEEAIGLTFNISWGEEKVHDILEQLEEHQVQATFFLSGEWAERHPDIVEKIAEGEHEIGMLGYRYKSYLDQEVEDVRSDLIKAAEVFEKLGYEEIQLLRTPSGHFDQEIIDLAEQMNYQVVHWNVNPNDWENPGTDVIVDHVMKGTGNGDIILMHASDSAKQTAEALKTILPGLKNKDFQFVSVTELINQAHADSELVE